jgi:hypothetical protein
MNIWLGSLAATVDKAPLFLPKSKSLFIIPILLCCSSSLHMFFHNHNERLLDTKIWPQKISSIKLLSQSAAS